MLMQEHSLGRTNADVLCYNLVTPGLTLFPKLQRMQKELVQIRRVTCLL